MARQVVIDRDRGWNRIKRTASRDQDTYLAVGILGDRDDRTDDELGNAEIGTIHEFGAPQAGIPERSFLRSTLDANTPRYRKIVRSLADQILDGKTSIEQALGLFGTAIVADVKRTIQRGVPPPLADKTVVRKGSSKQLIDSGQLINSVTHEVRRR